MTASLTSIAFSFVLVTIVGGIFAQRLQHANWVRQQRLSHQDRVVAELKSIFVELDSLLGRRLYRTRRLLYAVRRFDATVLDQRISDYDKVICEWNDKRNSFQIRLVRRISIDLANQFEHDLSRRFIRIGLTLERLARLARQNNLPSNYRTNLTELEEELNQLSRSTYEFLRGIYIRLQNEQERVFVDGSFRVPQDLNDLDQVSTWYLLKSLFIPPRQSFEEP